MKLKFRLRRLKGGAGSGHHGHAGIPGHRGGSLPGKGGGVGAISGSSIMKNAQVRSFLGSGAKVVADMREENGATYTTIKRSWPGGRVHSVDAIAMETGGYKARISGSPSRKYQVYRGSSSWGRGKGATVNEAIKNAFADAAKTLNLPSAEQVDAAPEEWQ